MSVQGARRDLHPIVREEGFLIAREALSNAFRHAGAGDIEAEVTYEDAALHVRIRDDGQGISPTVLEAGRRQVTLVSSACVSVRRNSAHGSKSGVSRAPELKSIYGYRRTWRTDRYGRSHATFARGSSPSVPPPGSPDEHRALRRALASLLEWCVQQKIHR